MKRFHVHIAVEDIASNIQFYSRLFAKEPSKQKKDYAKWILDDPAINFAISSRGHSVGVNHFGIQVSSHLDLSKLKSLASLASLASNEMNITQGETQCCYARSEKHWVIDPQGIPWEHFHTLNDSETFGDSKVEESSECCTPLHSKDTTSIQNTSCCIPNTLENEQQNCCSKTSIG